MVGYLTLVDELLTGDRLRFCSSNTGLIPPSNTGNWLACMHWSPPLQRTETAQKPHTNCTETGTVTYTGVTWPPGQRHGARMGKRRWPNASLCRHVAYGDPSNMATE